MFALTLPPPALHPNNPHLASALRHISIATIPHSQRNILRAVTLHAPNPRFVAAIPLIQDPAELDYLATLCRRALIAFKSRGGRPKSAASTPAKCGSPIPYIDPDSDPLLTGTTPGPTPQVATDLATHSELTSLCTIFNLGSSITLFPAAFIRTPLERICSSRSAGFANSLKLRDDTPHCLITGGSINLVGAHIIPHSLVKIAASPTLGAISFWLFLVFFLGIELRDELYGLLAGDEGIGNGCANGVCLGEAMHGLFDTGLLTLEPLYPSDSEADDHITLMEVALKWHHWEYELSLYQTILPRSVNHTEATADNVAGRVRASPIRNGDIFTVKTRDAQNYPLPIRGFLQLHDILWTLIAAAGLLLDPDNAPTVKLKQQNRKRRKVEQVKEAIPPTTAPVPSELATPTAKEPTPSDPIPQAPPSTTSSHQYRSISHSSTQSSEGSAASSIFDVTPSQTDTLTWSRGSIRPHSLPWEPCSSPPPIDLVLLPQKRKRGVEEVVPFIDEKQKDDVGFDDHGHKLGPQRKPLHQGILQVNNVVSAEDRDGGYIFHNHDSASKLDRAIALFGEYWPAGQRSHVYHPEHLNQFRPIGVAVSGWKEEGEDEGEDEEEEDEDREWDASDSGEEDYDTERARRFDQGLMALFAGASRNIGLK
ncbi:hypothetical protein L211DRAFT_852741 [Terfezia boudieri ATCC MYA-4762]|uniref:HNH nuclease domain-containing protein n=1 Tax=Terfezia boudieri ATCC MYA-4762 TaxID=1051890 RepID=A0A3N4LPP3_9PEZI|nr:hypothetical protein L211DRAFT_852741 [Terfezia boudieri ATCC MYA-4762]